MGDHGGWAQPGRPQVNGLIPGEESSVTQVLDVERWTAAEKRTATLIRCIQPSRPSEARRSAVADYVRRLIMNCISCEVFTFGSVPLKTYLPDGDIDLSAFSRNPHLKDSWANEVRQALENEEKNENAEFHVKEVQYIQAEVKIIKCLVENIVVDISFNQLGGLCTLCFLEEVDNLINQNYLYKQSIILIKAWCYYESRILGAHHGLISTYALETLVLYIFNVFNKSFAGPLEVLFRFLEFFSNFDWENFCVSLRGPVPISSLPDTTAEPPRKDGEKLLLDELFLNSCHTAYAVHPLVQEKQGQPFVSKHFNVIDPLRTNNNLGRSVSKGNFYRIRSAFTFGAKRLASLLDCPKDGLIAEVDKFFMNTWRRHGSGHRPDAPTLDMRHLQPINTSAIDDVEILGNSSEAKEKVEAIRLHAGLEYRADGLDSFNSIPQPANASAERAQNVWRTNSPSSYPQSQKNYDSQAKCRALNTMGRSINSSKNVPSDEYPKYPDPDSFVKKYEGPGRFQFARTQSSPELTDSFPEMPSHGRGHRLGEVKTQFSSGRPDQSSKMKNYGAGFSGVHTARSINDSATLGHSLSQQSLSGIADSNSVSNSYHDDSGYENLGDDSASVSESLEMQQTMQQEEQDLINMMASSRINSPQPAIHISPHFPVPLSPVLASMGYSHRHPRAMLANSFSEFPWGSNIQLPHGIISSPIPNYFSNCGLGSSPEEIPDSSNGDSTDQEDSDHWIDRDTRSSQGLLSEKKNAMPYFEGKQLPTLGGFSYVPSSLVSDSGVSERSQHKSVRGNKVSARKEYTDVNSRENDIHSLETSGDLKFISTLQTSRNRTISESWEGSFTQVSKSPRDKRGRKPYSLHGKAKSGLEQPPFDDISVPTDDDCREGVTLTTALGTDAEQTMGSSPLAASHVQGIQIPGYEPALMSGSNQVIPFGPIIVCAGPAGSRQRTPDSSGVGPMAFYPTGPPVPFLTMLPMYNYPSDSGNPDGPSDQFNGVDASTAKSSDQNYSFCERSEQPEALTASNSARESSSEQCEQHEYNILSSDFARHWQNLQFARLCQNTHSQGSLYYPSPVAVPQLYLQGAYLPNSSGPGRPPSANIGAYSQIMNYGPRPVPVAPLQPSTSRPTGVYQRYGEEAPRYRGGTGTYLPNPKVAFRDRQPSTTRNHRGYNHDRSEHCDRDGSWVSSKSRGSRNHGRLHQERPSSRGDTYRHERMPSHLARNNSFSSASSDNVSTDMSYGLYSLPSTSSNGVRPAAPALSSVVMLYSYDPVAGYGSSTEHVEFGSMHLPVANEGPYPNEGSSIRSIHEQRHGPYQRSSPNSSPDRPSSPQSRRGI